MKQIDTMMTLRVKLLRKHGQTEGALFSAAASAASAMIHADEHAPGNALADISEAMDRLRYARRRIAREIKL